MNDNSPFHDGEIEVQNIVGERAMASKLGSMIQNSITLRALDFIREQSIIWIGIEDQDSCLWSFPLFGSSGFIDPGNGEQLDINFDGNFYFPDEWRSQLKKGKYIGCLVIDLSTRRRIRINGHIGDISNKRLLVDVEQAYPNCPKYIRKREVRDKFDSCEFSFISKGIELNDQVKSIINRSDTAFVASLGPNGMDVSHRGGGSGFIKCHTPDKVLMPDYKGNSMFNTLGNFKANPFGGLTVVDFTKGYFLQLTGEIEIIFDKEASEVETGGTNRYWELRINKWNLFQLKSNFKWEELDFSPYNP